VATKPAPIDAEAAQRFLTQHPAWSLEGGALYRRVRFSSYADGLGFAVALGLVAERRDHHPELTVAWGSVGVAWSTHDVGGLSDLDLELALETDRIAARHGAEAP
jgi:4a-hydroxytetrahydrobiopterin dehydratase